MNVNFWDITHVDLVFISKPSRVRKRKLRVNDDLY